MSNSRSASGAVRRHTFPEVRTEGAPVPNWMQGSGSDIRPAHFGRVQGHSDPHPTAAASNVQPDPLADERATLAAAKTHIEQERLALETLREELEKERAAVVDAVQGLTKARQQALQASVDGLAEIAVTVVRAIIVDAFSEAPERAAALAHEALSSHEDAELRVGPALHIALLESGESSSATLDTTLPPYGCVAESPSHVVIAGLEDRLSEVLRALKEAT